MRGGILSSILAVSMLLWPASLPAAQAGRAADWPNVTPVASYSIQVQLDPGRKTLSGHETITYLNTTTAEIPDLVFHLYLNAFKDLNSLFFQESGPSHRGYSWDPEHAGWIEVTGLRLSDGRPLTLSPLADGTLARAPLPEPVPAGGMIELKVDFRAQLPRVFARTGYAGDFFMVGQWFPKLGVWQTGGWNAYPFHANSEFFADFGTYDVEITLPADFLTGATGLPVSTLPHGDGTKTVSYHAEAVIDFGWTASPQFVEASRSVDGIEVLYLYLPEHASSAPRILDAAETALVSFGAWYGPYPYPRLTVVDVPEDGAGAGGMEYPTLVTAGVLDPTGAGLMKGQFDRFLESVAIHEIGHQWWYAMAAFNEAEEPWLDEGFTDYSAVRLMHEAYGPNDILQGGNVKMSYFDVRRAEYLALPQTPMYGKAWEFGGMGSYGVAAYSKPVMALTTLERTLGEDTMLALMSTFFRRYQFSHPTTEDFRAVAREVSGQDLDWFFDGLVYGDGILNYSTAAVDEHSVTVTRQGELIIPTEVLVSFEDGTSRLQPWNGEDQQHTFAFPQDSAVTSAQIDPDQKIAVDLQWGDNGLSRRMDAWSWSALVTRLLYQIQNLILWMGGL